MDEIKTLSKNITHLSIYQIKGSNDKCFESTNIFELEDNNSSKRRDMLWNFIKLFKNVKQLNIVIDRLHGIIRLFSENIPSLETLGVSLDDRMITSLYIDSFVFKTENISHIKRLDIRHYYINGETLQRITNDMNLKSFRFSCYELNINLLSNLAEKHKDLNRLSILWSNFMPYSYVENLFKFENVRHFALNNSLSIDLIAIILLSFTMRSK